MTASKIVAAAASSGGSGPLDIDDVFSCHLYDGASNLVITNGIDLAGEGGLVWGKGRSNADGHWLVDSERGTGSNNNFKYLRSEGTQAEQDISSRSLSSFNSNGFTFQGADAQFNASGQEYVTWTFRKAPKFFDIVTYTGNGVAGRTISHNLDNLVGMVMIKCTSHTSDWSVQHRMILPNKYLALNGTAAQQTDTARFHSTAAGASTFSVGSGNAVNGSGRTYVAYLFSHNNNGNPGEFGPDEDQDIIKCGSYTGNGSATGPVIDLGFEPQWLMLKNASTAYNWIIVDVMRGWSAGPTANTLFANQINTEDPAGTRVKPTSTGFEIITDSFDYNKNTDTFVYMAIRRGPLAAPDDATKVFSVNKATSSNTSTVFNTGFDVDMNINTEATSGSARYTFARLIGANYLNTDGTTAENGGPSTVLNSLSNVIDLSSGWWGPQSGVLSYSWRRAPSYFDCVCYKGTGSNRTVSHNLGAVPEMMWIKRRDSTNNWAVYHKGLDSGNNPETHYLILNTTAAEDDVNEVFNDTAPTSSVFSVGTASLVNNSSSTFIAYLFATVAGVSKVGSVTHSSGSTTNVDCGFSSGARFVLVKSTASGEWRVWDSVRGIVAGNDPYLHLNDTSAEITNGDLIDPYSSGFALSPGFYSDTYIFYAIA